MSKKNENEIVDTEAIIEMEDINGNVLRFQHVMTFPYKEDFYVALTAAEENDEIGEDEVVIMRVVEDEDGDLYEAIESEEELDEIWEEFEKQYYEEED